MGYGRTTRVRPALDAAALERLALHYVGRYATTQAKLGNYLRRKIAERGWDGTGEPPIAAIVERCANARYVDDAAYADARSSGLARRGYGTRRIVDALRHAGIDSDTIDQCRLDDDAALNAALAFARRRGLGPFGAGLDDDAAIPGERIKRTERAIAAMVRAGHDYRLARKIVEAGSIDELLPN